jgi:unsaturated rhamnogalacturonyl hydrolase
MNRQIFDSYIQSLLDNSTLDIPAWNVENARKGKANGWNYIDGCMILALLEIYQTTGEQKYLDFADAFIDHRVQEDGSITGYDVTEYNIDNVNAGKTLFSLYALNGKEKYRKAIDLIYSQILTQPRTAEGNFWHKQIYPNQVWLDGLYMGQPFYMEYETKCNGKQNYEDIFHQFETVVARMRDRDTGLYYHAYDASKTAFWCDKETGLSANFWLRALGWYSMALLDTLDKCDIADTGMESRYENLKKVFVDLMDAMLAFRDENGMWYQLPALRGQEPNYPETSGSAIMAYSFLKGVRLGFLPKSYQAYGVEAFEGICKKYLSDQDGKLHLGGICLVAGLGPENNKRRDGSFAYYMSEPVVEDDAKGVGPLLLAYTELLREHLI